LFTISGPVAHQPERAVAADGLVGGKGQSREGEDLGGFGDPAIVGVSGDVEEIKKAFVVERKLPLPGELGELRAQSREAGAIKWAAGRERQRHGLDVGGKIDAATLGAQGQEIGQGLMAQLVGRLALEVGPADICLFAIVQGFRSFPFPFATEGMVEGYRDLFGETRLERPASTANREAKSHDEILEAMERERLP
jgi:hypothetical protein